MSPHPARYDVDFPYRFDDSGWTAAAGAEDHVRDMIEQLLFTAPGERVNRPELGSGILQLVFSPNTPEVAAALQFSVQAALIRWLGDVIDVSDVRVQAEDATLRVEIDYALRRTGEERTDTFSDGVR
ncbi:MAG: GPW/gp25 family protein [Acidimicrobiales bacterium]